MIRLQQPGQPPDREIRQANGAYLLDVPLVFAQILRRRWQIVIVHVVNLPSGIMMRSSDHNGLSAVNDIRKREQVTSSHMEEHGPDLQADPVGESSAAWPID